MADLTLADVERTEGSLKRYLAAQDVWNAEHPNHTVKAQDELRDAYGELAAGMVVWSRALLALAREALERRNGPRIVERKMLPSQIEDDHA